MVEGERYPLLTITSLASTTTTTYYYYLLLLLLLLLSQLLSLYQGWWLNLLYIQNFTTGQLEQCYDVGWVDVVLGRKGGVWGVNGICVYLVPSFVL